MEMTQKEVFEALVQGLLGDSLSLTKRQQELFDLKKNYFHGRYNCKNPNKIFNEKCRERINKMYGSIGMYDRDMPSKKNKAELLDEKQKIERLKYETAGRLFEKIPDIISKFEIEIEELKNNGLVEIIVETILSNFENSETMDLGKTLSMIQENKDIQDSHPEFGIAERGQILVDRYLAIADIQIANNFNPDSIISLGLDNCTDEIKANLRKQNYAVLKGASGTGKYTAAATYAQKNESKYDVVLCLKWKGNFEDTIAENVTTDDPFYENEDYETKKQRKLSIWKNSTQTRLLVIYDINSEPKLTFLDKYANDICNIIACVKIRTRRGAVKSLKLTDKDYSDIACYYIKGWSRGNNSADINRLKQISGGNFYMFCLMLEYIRAFNLFDNLKIIYDHLIERPNKNSLYGKYQFRFTYHDEEKTDTLYGHIMRIAEIEGLYNDQENSIFILAESMTKEGKLYYAEDSIRLLGVNEEMIAEAEKRYIIDWDKNADEICMLPVTRLAIFRNSKFAPGHLLNYYGCCMSGSASTITDFYVYSLIIGNYLDNEFNLAENKDTLVDYASVFNTLVFNIYLGTYRRFILPIHVILKQQNDRQESIVFDSCEFEYVLRKEIIGEVSDKMRGKLADCLMKGVLLNIDSDKEKPKLYYALVTISESLLCLFHFGDFENLYSAMQVYRNSDNLSGFIGSSPYIDSFDSFISLYLSYQSDNKEEFDSAIKRVNTSIEKYKTVSSDDWFVYAVNTLDLSSVLFMFPIKADWLEQIYLTFKECYEEALKLTKCDQRHINIVTVMLSLEVLIYGRFNREVFDKYFMDSNDPSKGKAECYLQILTILSSLIAADHDKKEVNDVVDILYKIPGFNLTDNKRVLSEFFKLDSDKIIVEEKITYYQKMKRYIEKIKPRQYEEISDKLQKAIDGLGELLAGRPEDSTADTCIAKTDLTLPPVNEDNHGQQTDEK